MSLKKKDVDKKLAKIDEFLPFFAHFGHFVWQFASVEKMCHSVFHNQCGLTEEMARMLIGGEQLEKVLRLLTVVVNSKADANKTKEMQTLVDQINVIKTLRHNLIHRGADRIKDVITVTNKATAKSREAVEIQQLDLQNIKDAAEDLGCITIRLVLFQSPSLVNDFPQPQKKAILAPWRYKSVEPDKPFQQPHNTRR